MKKKLLLFVSLSFMAVGLYAQDGNVQTVFGGSVNVTGYGALTNKFTTLRGEFANMTGAYGGIYLNHKFLIGIGASAVTNNIPVPIEFSSEPDRDMSYEMGQVGLVNEYVFNSDKAIHFAINLFTGSGFTVQYERSRFYPDNYTPVANHDENWFFVMEPGAQVEINLMQWMRLSTGVSYRKTFGGETPGLTEKDLSGASYNVALKFGKF